MRWHQVIATNSGVLQSVETHQGAGSAGAALGSSRGAGKSSGFRSPPGDLDLPELISCHHRCVCVCVAWGGGRAGPISSEKTGDSRGGPAGPLPSIIPYHFRTVLVAGIASRAIHPAAPARPSEPLASPLGSPFLPRARTPAPSLGWDPAEGAPARPSAHVRRPPFAAETPTPRGLGRRSPPRGSAAGTERVRPLGRPPARRAERSARP